MGQLDQKKFRKYVNQDINPCLKEAEQSMKCLEDSNYINKKCTLYFNNYTKCKQFWTMIRSLRSQNGIKPTMPTEKERKLILDERKKGNLVHSIKLDGS